MPTGRGWVCIAGAAGMLGAGTALRIPELTEIGVALLVLVVVQLARMLARGRDLTATRLLQPPSGMAGSPVTIEVTVHARPGRRPLPPGEALVWVDPAPQPSPHTSSHTSRTGGGTHRIELMTQSPRRAGARYQLTPARRGLYVIGPGRVASTDPFGLVHVPRTTGNPSTLIVFPRLEPLTGRTPRAAGSAGARSASAASVATGSEFFATREWRPGDDMRRIHWRSTARMGTVMVRQEELPRRDRATVVLDDRRSSYREGDEFERAVEAAASLVHHFLREGFAVRLATSSSSSWGPHGKGAGHHRLLMTTLATVELSAAAVPPGLPLPESGDLVVLVGGVPEAARHEWLSPVLERQDALVVLTGHVVAETLSPRVLHVTPGHPLAAAWAGL